MMRSAPRQAFGEEAQPIAVPEKDLDRMRLPAAKGEQMTGERRPSGAPSSDQPATNEQKSGVPSVRFTPELLPRDLDEAAATLAAG
jgi:hypothetical protein